MSSFDDPECQMDPAAICRGGSRYSGGMHVGTPMYPGSAMHPGGPMHPGSVMHPGGPMPMPPMRRLHPERGLATQVCIGLDSLAGVDQFNVVQHLEIGELLTGVETNNSYTVMDQYGMKAS